MVNLHVLKKIIIKAEFCRFINENLVLPADVNRPVHGQAKLITRLKLEIKDIFLFLDRTLCPQKVVIVFSAIRGTTCVEYRVQP